MSRRGPFFCCMLILYLMVSVSSSNSCDSGSLPDPRTLRADQLTVLISGYSESRLPLLSSLAASYSLVPFVAAVLVLWGNQSTPTVLLSSTIPVRNGIGAAPISILRLPSSSLNARFLPRAAIRTRAVAVCDDDVEVDSRSFTLAFSVWKARSRGIVGFFARSHDLDLRSRSWIYTVHPDRYSIVLTKFMILPTEYLHHYSCSERLNAARLLVDRERNCEDILMNFISAIEIGEGPTLVEGRHVRDWGDPRNNETGNNDGGRGTMIQNVGLSARGDHRKRRGKCISEFHRILGEMPLRYNYGKMVGEVGEQGLCHKGGKLVFCDQQ